MRKLAGQFEKVNKTLRQNEIKIKKKQKCSNLLQAK